MTEHAPPPDSPGRRRFLAAGLGMAVACPALQGCEFVEVFDTPMAAPGEIVNFDVAAPEYAALDSVGGSACLVVGSLDLMLVRVTDDEVIAYERICPHENLPLSGCGGRGPFLDFDAAQQRIRCPFHNSIFDRDGALVSGPAPRSIRAFPASFDPEAGTGILRVDGPPAESATSAPGASVVDTGAGSEDAR
ncbi:MAG: Rieske (2Fe-2S) protein [Deltaproteobacteria bacterium]|nr:MAG: Rieske (2Fe-2S) protein [Deltaproteobacteria bacterium]